MSWQMHCHAILLVVTVNGLAEEGTQVAAMKSTPTTIDGVLKMNPAVGCSKYDLMDKQSKDSDVKAKLDYLHLDCLWY